MFEWMRWFFVQRPAAPQPVSVSTVDPWEVIYDGQLYSLREQYERPWVLVPFFERDFEFGYAKYRLALLRVDSGHPARVSVHVYMQILSGFTSEHFWVDEQGYCYTIRDGVTTRASSRDLLVAMRYFYEHGLLPC